jgi:hypothetical protein
LKSAIPVGNAGKEWKIVNHIEGMVPKNPRAASRSSKAIPKFLYKISWKVQGLRGVVPEWETALEVASLLEKLASSVPNRQICDLI